MGARREGGVIGHVTGSGGAHQDLAKRLQRGPVAMVEPQDPAARRAWREILEILFSPDEAALASRLPVVPTTFADLARRTGMGEGELRARLEVMAGKGLVLDLHDARTGATTYMLAPPVVGFFELSMMRLNDGLPKERLARAYDAYMADDTTLRRGGLGSPHARQPHPRAGDRPLRRRRVGGPRLGPSHLVRGGGRRPWPSRTASAVMWPRTSARRATIPWRRA